jgi:hypothetical protein
VADNLIQQNTGAFVPTNYIWDIQQLYQIENIDPELRELLVRLYQNVNSIALVLNVKDSAIYDTQQFVNGQLYFPNPALNSTTAQTPELRQVYRVVVNFGALPNSGVKSLPHGITCTSLTTATRIYGAATNPVSPFSYIPLPYSSVTAVADNIELYVDGTNVNVATAANYSAYTISYIIFEFLQN